MSVQQHVAAALTAVKKAQELHADYLKAIDGLRRSLSKDREKGRAVLLPCVASFYGVPVVDGAGKAEGQKVLDSDAPKYEAAKTALRRMVNDIYGSNESGSADVVAQALRLVAKMTAAQKRKFIAAL